MHVREQVVQLTVEVQKFNQENQIFSPQQSKCCDFNLLPVDVGKRPENIGVNTTELGDKMSTAENLLTAGKHGLRTGGFSFARNSAEHQITYHNVTPEPEMSRFHFISEYMFMMMLRNFATDGWRFSTYDKENHPVHSRPGCIIASPSQPRHPETDQDYVHFWVRDGALTIMECAHKSLPDDEMLNDYVSFCKEAQDAAIRSGKNVGHACFKIDGSVRDWSEQADGPALRILSILTIWDKLDAQRQQVGKDIIATDIEYLLQKYQEKTHNLWEEADGYSFFARAVQLSAFRRVLGESRQLNIALDISATNIAISWLEQALKSHWVEADGYYHSVLDAADSRGAGLNIDIIMSCVYGGQPCFTERMLRSAAAIHQTFSGLYDINAYDRELEMGPLMGRYPQDYYDGDLSDAGDDVGHPWPLATSNFAQFYYTCIEELKGLRSFTITDKMAPFMSQIGFHKQGQIKSNSEEYKDLVYRLLKAGDRMQRAVVYHSNHLELSEQFDRWTGFEKSVLNLTWSYSAFVSATRTRDRVAPYVNALTGKK